MDQLENEDEFQPDYEEALEEPLGRKVGLKSKTRFCGICVTRVPHVKRHIIRKHFPWYICPVTACWECGEQLIQMGKRESHYLKWGHGRDAYFGNKSFDTWCKLMCGVLYFFCSELQVGGMEALQEYVVGKKLHPEGCEVSEVEQLLFLEFGKKWGISKVDRVLVMVGIVKGIQAGWAVCI